MPVRWRLTVFNALAIGTILVLLGLALVFFLERSLVSDLRETVADRAYSTAEAVQNTSAGEQIDEERVDELTLDGVFIIVRDESGTVITQTDDLSTNQPDTDRVWSAALEAGAPAAGTTNLSPEAPEYVYAIPLETPGGVQIVEAGMTYQGVTEALSSFRTVLTIGILAGLLLSVIGAYLLARAALAPIELLTRETRDIEAEDLSRRLRVEHERDEVGRLTLAINALLGRLESAFERREEALEEQRRFVADAGHELRTPLTSISGYASMLGRWGLEDQETARESISAIERESGRMNSLVEELLTLARGDENMNLQRERWDLTSLVREAADDARITAAGRVAVEHEYEDSESGDGILAVFDRSKVRQAVSILLDNAVKYTPEGGRVGVRAFAGVGFVGVAVSDDGVGIPEEHQPKVFERFHRVDSSRSTEGSGLGLAIARQIAVSHGGDISLESVPDRGSTFTLTLPESEQRGSLRVISE